MLCQSCKKHPATVHTTEIQVVEDQETVQTLHLCAPCAHQSGIPIPNAVSLPKMVSMLGKALLGSSSEQAKYSSSAAQEACPACGWTLRDFRQTSRFGCPHDYEVFSAHVEDLLDRIHGTSKHPRDERAATIGRLRNNLEKAVLSEDYELAAAIRDQIRALESDASST